MADIQADINLHREMVIKSRITGHQTVCPYHLAMRRVRTGEFELIGERPFDTLPKTKQQEILRLQGKLTQPDYEEFAVMGMADMPSKAPEAAPVAASAQAAQQAAAKVAESLQVDNDEDETDEDEDDEPVFKKKATKVRK